MSSGNACSLGVVRTNSLEVSKFVGARRASKPIDGFWLLRAMIDAR